MVNKALNEKSFLINEMYASFARKCAVVKCTAKATSKLYCKKHALPSFQPGKSTSPACKSCRSFDFCSSKHLSAFEQKHTKPSLSSRITHEQRHTCGSAMRTFLIRHKSHIYKCKTNFGVGKKPNNGRSSEQEGESYYHLKSKFVIYCAAPPSDKHLSFGADKFE
jgi:hypothetical protein